MCFCFSSENFAAQLAVDGYEPHVKHIVASFDFCSDITIFRLLDETPLRELLPGAEVELSSQLALTGCGNRDLRERA